MFSGLSVALRNIATPADLTCNQLSIEVQVFPFTPETPTMKYNSRKMTRTHLYSLLTPRTDYRCIHALAAEIMIRTLKKEIARSPRWRAGNEFPRKILKKF